MELKIFDYDFYNQDLAAQKTKGQLEPLLGDVEGLWLYREPEIKTAGDDFPTFTVVSPKMGLVFFRVYNYTEETLTYVSDKFWTIDGQKVRSECMIWRS